jgi:hypothetical protein
MIDRFTQSLKDPAKLSLLLTFLFFIGILITGYVMYTLPQDMMWSQSIHILNMDMARSVFIKPAVVIVLTFGFAIAAISSALKAKKETIVYLEKKKDTTNSSQSGGENGNNDSADVASFRSLIQNLNNQKDILQQGLNAICKQVEAGQGAAYLATESEGKRVLEVKQGFALTLAESQSIKFEFGEGLIGQAALSGQNLYLDEVPEGYIKIVSGLGTSSPRYLFIVPLKKENEVKGVIEIATFAALKENMRKQVDEMAQILAGKIS